ncbi:MAG: AbrB/MazE/SpoVT family DNA-binding domain-containing protein [Actinomycetota bacterium]
MGKKIVTVQSRGVLAIPAEIRRDHHIEQGSQVEISSRDDGVIEIRPVLAVVDAAHIRLAQMEPGSIVFEGVDGLKDWMRHNSGR